MEITKDIFFMLVDLYENLQTGFFKKTNKIDRKTFCNYVGILDNNHLTYMKVITALNSGECILGIHDGFGSSKIIEIDNTKLDRLIRSTKYFHKIDEFIFKSTGGIAETGV
jgi:hypothetical protein